MAMLPKQLTAARRVIGACLVLLVAIFSGMAPPSSSAHEDGGGRQDKPRVLATTRPTASFRAARKLALMGEYAQAIAMFDELAAAPGGALKAACGRAEIDLACGDYLSGLDRLKAVRADGERDAAWNAVTASLLTEVGAYESAIERNQAALKLDPGNFRARRQLGRLYELLGRYEEAIQTYRPFNDVMTGDALPDDAEALTDLGDGFLRFSALTRHADLVNRTRHVLTEVLQEASDFVDAGYWPARLAAAELLLEKHNLPEAKEEFEAVLKVNPKAASAHVGLGRLALEEWAFEEAEARVQAARKVNPRCVAADVLLADLRLTERRNQEAEEAARRALETNPQSPDALARLAAAQTRLGSAAAGSAVEQARKIAPKAAALDYVLGVWQAADRQYAAARKHFERAIDLAPHWPEPHTALGQVFMDIGEEVEARKALDAAFTLDSFNVQTHNVLELLDTIDRFARQESAHFIIKYAPTEEVAVPYLVESLEAVYPDVCKAFGMAPGEKTIIQVFPDHRGFSVRVTGRPFIATVGACSGRVIAMAAPRGMAPFGHYNWAHMLRHEFTHTVTLAATENRIPHWMTEGMAVMQEPHPRSWRVKQLLWLALRQGRLFSVTAIDWGFMRPRRPDDRMLAYMQSEWMLEYAVERHGEKVLVGLLKEFRAGRKMDDAFHSVLGQSPEAFEAEFRTWAEMQVANWGLPTSRLRERDTIHGELEEDRDNPALWGEFAEAELLEGRMDEAEEAARRGLERNKMERRCLDVLSTILVWRAHQQQAPAVHRRLIEAAAPFLRRLNAVDRHNASALKFLGYLEQARENWDEAIGWLERHQASFPDDPDSYRRLSGIFFRLGRREAALAQLEKLAGMVEDEPSVAQQVAAIHAERKDHAAAARWYRVALEIDPYDGKTHAGLAEALLTSGDARGALREFEVVCKVWPDRSTGYDGLARSYEASGDHERAEKHRKEAEAKR